MKDISKMMLGIFRIDLKQLKNSKSLINVKLNDVIINLWKYECTRVISDRFIEEPDLEKYNALM